MIHLTDAETMQEAELEIGTEFWECYQGYTSTGLGMVSRIWRVTESMGNGLYLCIPLSDNTVRKLNTGYRQLFDVNDIKRIMKKTPIIN